MLLAVTWRFSHSSILMHTYNWELHKRLPVYIVTVCHEVDHTRDGKTSWQQIVTLTLVIQLYTRLAVFAYIISLSGLSVRRLIWWLVFTRALLHLNRISGCCIWGLSHFFFQSIQLHYEFLPLNWPWAPFERHQFWSWNIQSDTGLDDTLLNTECEWSPSTCSGASEVDGHVYIETDRQHSKNHLFVMFGAEDV
jgi:hypothetical protein